MSQTHRLPARRGWNLSPSGKNTFPDSGQSAESSSRVVQGAWIKWLTSRALQDCNDGPITKSILKLRQQSHCTGRNTAVFKTFHTHKYMGVRQANCPPCPSSNSCLGSFQSVWEARDMVPDGRQQTRPQGRCGRVRKTFGLCPLFLVLSS